MNFITSRLSKDNFWNLVVYFGILLSVGIAQYNESILLLISAFTVTPYLLTRFNKVKYLEDGTCVNSQGEDLNSRMPEFIFVIIILSVIFSAFGKATELLDFIGDLPEVLKAPTFIGFILLWPFLYLIIKNCPVSILFNIESWLGDASQSSSGFMRSSNYDSTKHHRQMSNSHAHSSSRNDLITSPVYSHMPQNVYHNNHHRRY